MFTVVDVDRDDDSGWLEAFASGGILRFRGQGEWSVAERLAALDFVGLPSGWRCSRPDNVLEPMFTYVEDHSHTFEMTEVSGRGADNSEFIPWHIESPNWFYPQIAAGWLFSKVECRRGTGLTGFVDARDVYDLLPDSGKDLAGSLRICGFDQSGFDRIESFEALEAVEGRIPVVFTDQQGASFTQYAHPVVQDHLNSDAKVLRMFPSYDLGSFSDEHAGMAVFVNDEPAISSDWDEIRRLYEFVASTVRKRDLQTWVSWESGDFVIVDLHAGYHAVSGGFLPEERLFEGVWGHEDTEFRIEHASRPNGVDGLV
jgi:alpha-ketoglutarate-dependent taurine dioxygenase